MHLRAFLCTLVFAGLAVMPVRADVFLCAAPEIVGSSPTASMGGVDLSQCSQVSALSMGAGSGVVDARRAARATCKPVVVTTRLDQSAPEYLRFAFEGRLLQALRILTFGPDPDTGQTRQELEVTLSQVMIADVAQEGGPDGQLHNQITFQPQQIAAAFIPANKQANLDCAMATR